MTLALLSAGVAGAEGVTFSASTSVGMFLGGATELVLFQGYKVSELDWPLLPVFTSGARLDLSTTAGFRGNIELQSGFPGYDGIMTDSDFLNGDGVKTHFSQSNGYSEGIIVLDARFGWSFAIGAEETLKWNLFPYLSFQYLHFKWSARDGYLQYPPEVNGPPFTPWSPSEPKVPIYGTGIVYQQDYYIPAIGLMGTIPFSRMFSMTLSFTFSPYLWCNDVDDHIFRLLYFYAYMHGGILLEPRASLTFRLTPRLAFTLDALYRHISLLTGDTYMVQQGVGTTPDPVTGLPPGAQSATQSNGAGVMLDAGTITLSVDLTL